MNYLDNKKDYHSKDTIVSLYGNLKTLENLLMIRPRSKTLDTIFQVKLTVGQMADVLKHFAVGQAIPNEICVLMQQYLKEKEQEHPVKRYLLKKACSEADIDVDALFRDYDELVAVFKYKSN